MEMTFNKEASANFSLLMAAMPQANSLQIPAKQKTEKDSSQPAETDFSERLSAALDESAGRLETAGKVTVKKSQEKMTDSNSEAATGSLPYGIAPVTVESNDQNAANGAEMLLDLKNAALQGLAAATANVLPTIVQAVTPAVLSSPMAAALVGGVANAATEFLSPVKPDVATSQNVQQLPLQTENLLQPSTEAGNNPTGIVATNLQNQQPVLPQQPVTELAATPTVEIPAGNKVNQPVIDNMIGKEQSVVMVNEKEPDTGVVTTVQPVTQQQQGKPVDLPQPLQAPVDGELASPVQQQIRQDMLTAQVSTVITNPTVPAKQLSEPIPVQEVETTESENPKPFIGKVEPTLETVVKPTTEQEVPKRSMSNSETDMEAGLSEKNDASLSLPVGFDKVMASVNEPAVVTPPVAQPRPDLHEIVKQVMDGMISPAQQLKSSQVIVTLKPEHLGEVTVKINVDGDKVTAAFHAASTEVRGILESSLSQLKQEMSQQGWQFDSDGVFGGMQEFLSQQEQQQAQQQQMRSMMNHARPDDYDDALAFSSSGKLQVMSATAVDYRV